MYKIAFIILSLLTFNAFPCGDDAPCFDKQNSKNILDALKAIHAPSKQSTLEMLPISRPITLHGYISIACEGHEPISIDLHTGKVDIKDCPLDEQSKAFWNAMEKSFGHLHECQQGNPYVGETTIPPVQDPGLCPGNVKAQYGWFSQKRFDWVNLVTSNYSSAYVIFSDGRYREIHPSPAAIYRSPNGKEVRINEVTREPKPFLNLEDEQYQGLVCEYLRETK